MLKIVVTGFAATFPFGGVFWDYMQYLVGFRQLGHEVLYVEDTRQWGYDPECETFVENGERNAKYLGAQMSKLGPEYNSCWFYRDFTGKTYGVDAKRAADFCRSADLFVNISGACGFAEEYFSASRTALIDSDPIYTQARLLQDRSDSNNPQARERIRMLETYNLLFTFAENIDNPDCRVPNCGLNWIPTRQPVVHDCFETARVPVAERRRTLTTVGSWEPKEQGPVINGVAYKGKSSELKRFFGLAAVSAVPLEIALAGSAPVDEMRSLGWKIVDGYAVSRDPWIYRSYLANSLGEWSIAKNAYVASVSGWFSCRSACYLALGVPVIAQETGFSRLIPTGNGLFAFSTIEQAQAAIEEVARDPGRHGQAALELAREYFDSAKVLARLLDQAFAS
jgi:glycosyltransferase involved in cell wall biosynthesis